MAGFVFKATNPQDFEREEQERRERDSRHAMATHAALIEALKRLYEVDTVRLENRLSDLKLLHDDQADHALIVEASDNTLVVTRDRVTYNQEIKTMKQALDGAIIAFNNPRARTEEITLQGTLRERLLMTIAGQKLGLKLANPVTEADLDDALRAEYPAILAEAKQLFAGAAAPEQKKTEQKKTEQKKEAPVVAAVPPVAAAMAAAAAAAPSNIPANDPIFEVVEPRTQFVGPETGRPVEGSFMPGLDDRAIPAPALAEASAYREPQSHGLAFDDDVPVLTDIVSEEELADMGFAPTEQDLSTPIGAPEEILSPDEVADIEAGRDNLKAFLEATMSVEAPEAVADDFPSEESLQDACESLRSAIKPSSPARKRAPEVTPA